VAIVGDHPQRGIRFILERAEAPAVATPPCVYDGAAFTPDTRHTLTIAVDAAGNDIREKARLLVKTMVRHALTEGTAPPRRIMRWRGEK
jgi:hypothetical protein